MAAQPMKFCDTCAAPNALGKCSRCTIARYCDEQCQRQHFAQHRKICLPVRDKFVLPLGVREDVDSLTTAWLPFPSNWCEACGLPTQRECAECQMPYCSVSCEQKDHVQHLWVCKNPSEERRLAFAWAKNPIVKADNDPSVVWLDIAVRDRADLGVFLPRNVFYQAETGRMMLRRRYLSWVPAWFQPASAIPVIMNSVFRQFSSQNQMIRKFEQLTQRPDAPTVLETLRKHIGEAKWAALTPGQREQVSMQLSQQIWGKMANASETQLTPLQQKMFNSHTSIAGAHDEVSHSIEATASFFLATNNNHTEHVSDNAKAE